MKLFQYHNNYDIIIYRPLGLQSSNNLPMQIYVQPTQNKLKYFEL